MNSGSSPPGNRQPPREKHPALLTAPGLQHGGPDGAETQTTQEGERGAHLY